MQTFIETFMVKFGALIDNIRWHVWCIISPFWRCLINNLCESSSTVLLGIEFHSCAAVAFWAEALLGKGEISSNWPSCDSLWAASNIYKLSGGDDKEWIILYIRQMSEYLMKLFQVYILCLVKKDNDDILIVLSNTFIVVHKVTDGSSVVSFVIYVKSWHP